MELHAVLSAYTPSTSADFKDNASSSVISVILQPQPSKSGLSQRQAACSSSEHQASATASSPSSSLSSSVRTQVKPTENRLTPDGTQASTSSAHPQTRTQTQTQPQPGTSTQPSSSRITYVPPHLIQMKDVKVVALPQQPSIQASALITQPQLHPRTENPLKPVSRNQMQGNLIQIEPQPLAQAPAQLVIHPAQTPQVIPVVPPAVLIATAPERLGPPEAGHRIILGSQAPGEAIPNPPPQTGTASVASPARSVVIRVTNMNSNHFAPPAPPATVPNNGGEARLILAPNAERANAAPALVADPPAPEDIPQIEDARPGPSAMQERPAQQTFVRTLINGVVSITQTGIDFVSIT